VLRDRSGLEQIAAKEVAVTPRALFFLVAVALGLTRPAAAGVVVLVKSGDVAPDGRALSSFSSPAAGTKTKAAFLGVTSAVITKSGSTFATVVKTGDPLPAPLSGTFNSFFDPVINDSGNVAFRANVNSTGANSGLFYCCDAGAIVPIALTGGTMGGLLRVQDPPDMNNNADVVYKLANTELHLWSLATHGDVLLASTGMASPGGGTFRGFNDRPVVNNAQRVAFQADVSGGPEGIFVTAPLSTITACALEDTASPIAGGTFGTWASSGEVAINAGGKVVFTSNISLTGPDTSGVFLCDPSGPSVVTVAKEGDLVAGTPLTGFDDEFVGIDSADDVAFEGRFGSINRRLVVKTGATLNGFSTLAGTATEFAPRLPDIGRIIWRQGGTIQREEGTGTPVTVVGPTDVTPIGLRVSAREPSINNLDVNVFRATQPVLYRVSNGVLEAIATPGGPSPGVGTYAFIGAPAYRRSSLAFSAEDNGGLDSLIVLKKGNHPPIQAVRSTDPAPGGGTFDLDSDILDVTGSTVLFGSSVSGGTATGGLFGKNTHSGNVETVALEGDAAPSGGLFSTFVAVHPAGHETAFVATLDTAATGIFITSSSGPAQIVREGDVLPGTGGGTLGRLGPVAVNGKRVAFTGSVIGGTVADGVFLWDHGSIVRLVSQGDAAVGGATFGPLFADPIAPEFTSPPFALAKSPALIAPLVGGPASEGMFIAQTNGSVTPLVLTGDATPLGGIVSVVNEFEPISQVGNSVVFEAGLSGASSSLALMRAKP
jgi:hypothetical protein